MNDMFVVFRSDDFVQMKGFIARYELIKIGNLHMKY